MNFGNDVAGQGDAGSPGSGGASPYLRRGFGLAANGKTGYQPILHCAVAWSLWMPRQDAFERSLSAPEVNVA
jgi:hypothetical protein